MEADEHKEVEVAEVVVVVAEGIVGVNDAIAAGGGDKWRDNDGANLGFLLLGQVTGEDEEHKLFFVYAIADFVAEFEGGLVDCHTTSGFTGVNGHRA